MSSLYSITSFGRWVGTGACILGLWIALPTHAADKKTAEAYRIALEWRDCEKGFYDLLTQRQQLGGLIDHKTKSPCKTGKRLKAKKIDCPEDKKFSEIPPDLRSQIDAMMIGDPDDYPFKDDLVLEKVYPKVLEHMNSMIQMKCEKIQEYDN